MHKPGIGRNLILTRLDARALTRVLRAHVPDLHFMDGRGYPELYTWIDSLEQARGMVTGFVAPPGFRRSDLVHSSGACFGNIPRFWFWFFPTESDLGDGQPIDRPRIKRPTAGYVFGRHHPDDREHRNFLRRIVRLTQKISTNRTVWRHHQTGEIMAYKNGSSIWCGFHALQLCKEDPSYTLYSDELPPPGWVMPDLPWYK